MVARSSNFSLFRFLIIIVGNGLGSNELNFSRFPVLRLHQNLVGSPGRSRIFGGHHCEPFVVLGLEKFPLVNKFRINVCFFFYILVEISKEENIRLFELFLVHLSIEGNQIFLYMFQLVPSDFFIAFKTFQMTVSDKDVLAIDYGVSLDQSTSHSRLQLNLYVPGGEFRQNQIAVVADFVSRNVVLL